MPLYFFVASAKQSTTYESLSHRKYTIITCMNSQNNILLNEIYFDRLRTKNHNICVPIDSTLPVPANMDVCRM